MECRDDAPAIDMPNGLSSELNYQQKFIQAKDPEKPGPCNHSAMIAPSLPESMKGIDRE